MSTSNCFRLDLLLLKSFIIFLVSESSLKLVKASVILRLQNEDVEAIYFTKILLLIKICCLGNNLSGLVVQFAALCTSVLFCELNTTNQFH